MCGIFAYNGNQNSLEILVEGLKNLEYRGYDSAGIVAVNEQKEIFLEKSVGKVANLANKIDKRLSKSQKEANTKYTNGIAHTRWATHGGVTEDNTHPHISQNERFFVVHNGIIENYMELKEILSKKYSFYSQTDTEVIAKLLEDMFDGDIVSTVEQVTKKLTGAYAIAVIDRENPGMTVGTKLGSPMIVGKNQNEAFLASDINALNGIADHFSIMDDYEMVVLKNGKFKIFSAGQEIQKPQEKIASNGEKTSKGIFETYTEKEIHDIPNVLKNALNGRVHFETKSIHSNTLDALKLLDIENIEIIASGSSYFAGVVGKNWFEELADIKTEVRVSSEFLYSKFIPNKKTLYVFISQSGETADVRECVKMVKTKGCHTFGIVNVVGSTIARMCDMGLYTHSGIEVGVASTKNIIGQLAVLLTMALSMGLKKNLQMRDAKEIITALESLDTLLEGLLKSNENIKKIAKKYSQYTNFFFLGRNLGYGTACEASLKLKELSYLHSEAYSTGELKHGPLALISPQFPCIIINPKDSLYEKTLSNIKEIKARNGVVLGVITQGDTYTDVYDDIIEIPKCHEFLIPFLPLIPLWTLAVEIAKILGRDIDKPQNLAKSVTVE